MRGAMRRAAIGVVMLGVLAVAAQALAAPAPPANDAYLQSTIIPQAETRGSHATTFTDQVDTANATVQSDLFNPDAQGQPLTGGGPENLSCHGVSFGKTVWYDIHPRISIGAELVASGFATSVGLYQWDPSTGRITKALGCQTSTGLNNDFVVPFDLKAHKAYTVQIGGLTQGGAVAGGPLQFTATFYPDRDGDGTPDVIDGCPSLPGPTTLSGCPPVLHPTAHPTWTSSGSGIRLLSLVVDGIPGGSIVLARCAGCGPSQTVRAGRNASSVTLGRFAGRVLPAGSHLQIWVTKRATPSGVFRYGAIGSYISYPVAGGALGARSARCLTPGTRSVRRCPADGASADHSVAAGRVSPAFAARLSDTFHAWVTTP